MCERCGVLAAENARLRDELTEWRRQGRENASIVVESEVKVRWAEALRVPSTLVRGLILLAEREGRLVRREAIARACCLDFDKALDPVNSAKVCIHKLRRAMAAAGITGKIENVWGEGYRMPVETVAELRRLVFGESSDAADGERRAA